MLKEYILGSCDSKYFGSLCLTKLGVGITENSIESLDIKFPKKTLIEKSLAWSDLSNESRK